MNESPKPELWTVVANIISQRLYGEEQEMRLGTRLFSGGAKVYVVAAFMGTAENVIVIGRHRGSKKYIHAVIKADIIENFRLSLIYSPKVHEIASNISENGAWVTTAKKDAEFLLTVLPKWKANKNN